MSGLVATVGLWNDDKSIRLTKYTSHGHVPNPIEPKGGGSIETQIEAFDRSSQITGHELSASHYQACEFVKRGALRH
ncbi:hypothetical protein LPU83_pLPU83d_0608 (plasmid) [Rhizobium favelukesii]|uniref:Uncharacterized protein n=1 Tax=Rhizobium favelukesii TaxID=348824 RepID=W6RMJ0_9HYPH|nr:hypothetical protein LPU83_pLPU83d_0608 [Rhizobium favelukesii]